ncbi:MAG: acetate--CoA ligase family protein [Thermoanaerobaculia bacterium]
MKEIEKIFEKAKAEGRDFLLEQEGYFILNFLGLDTPQYIFLKDKKELKEEDLEKIPSEEVVLKIVSSKILHKSDVGGVVFLRKDFKVILENISEMEKKFKERDGFLVCEKITYEKEFAREIILGVKYSRDFGPILTMGFGGIDTEFYAKNFKSISIFSSILSEEEKIISCLKKDPLGLKLWGRMRGQKILVEEEKFLKVIKKFKEFSNYFSPYGEGNFTVLEFEVNPFVLKDGKMTALDFLLKFGEKRDIFTKKPIFKIKNLLIPESIAIIGVSEKSMNVGRIILNNIIREGFEREKIYCIKQNVEEIDGVKCYPSIKELPSKIDLLVLAVDAGQLPELIGEAIEYKKAESMILIPGGFGEKEGTKKKAAEIKEKLKNLREKGEETPILNGGNCLGIRSLKGKYDTFFIPEYKLPLSEAKPMNFALISQSGAFLVSKMNKLSFLNPIYSISLGNQIDLTVSDYFEYLKEDPDIDLFAFYVEGFQEGDGLKFAKILRKVKAKGKITIFYKAGRTQEGQKAASGHTASIAGDWLSTKEILEKEGAVFAENIEDFEDLIQIFLFLKEKEVKGTNIALISNAGFECVSMADNISNLKLAKFSKDTEEKLKEIFKKIKIDTIVDIHNPLDLTPMTNDAGYFEIIETLMKDENIHSLLIGAVPLTPALNTLEKSEKHREDFKKEDSLANRIIKIKEKYKKPFVFVVDGGKEYDPFLYYLKENEIPAFKTAEKAIKNFSKYINYFL